MRVNGYAWTLFLIPFFADVIILSGSKYDINFTLLVIAVSASLVGSTAYATKKNEEASLRIKNVVSIYSMGFFLSYLMYELAMYYQSMSIAGAGSAIVSYFSLEVIILIGTVIKGLPNVVLRIIESWGKK